MEITLPTREQALQDLRDGYRALREAFDSLPPGEAERPGSIGDGGWSAKDLLGHVTTWEEVALETLDDWRGGRPPRIEEILEGPAGLDRFNAEQAEKKKDRPLSAIRSEAEAVHRALLTAIEALSDDQWTAPYEQSRKRLALGEHLGGVLGAPDRLFGHVSAHLPELEDLAQSHR